MVSQDCGAAPLASGQGCPARPFSDLRKDVAIRTALGSPEDSAAAVQPGTWVTGRSAGDSLLASVDPWRISEGVCPGHQSSHPPGGSYKVCPPQVMTAEMLHASLLDQICQPSEGSREHPQAFLL